MKKNVAGQFVGAQLVNTAGASVTTGTTTVFLTLDGGTQATAATTASHEGNGQWTCPLAQGETNGNHAIYTFSNSAAVPVAVQTWPGDVFPMLVFSGNAQTATATSVTLPSSSGTVSQVGNILLVADGPGYGQARPITGYTATQSTASKVVTVGSAWDVTPTTASTLMIGAYGMTPLNADSAGNVVVGSMSSTSLTQIAATTISQVTNVGITNTVSNLSAGAIISTSFTVNSIRGSAFDTGSIDSRVIGANAIGSSEMSDSAALKIADFIWSNSSASVVVKGQVTAALSSDLYSIPTTSSDRLSTSNTIVTYLRFAAAMACFPRSSSTSTETVMNFTSSAVLWTASNTYTTASATATRGLFA